ncbi:MAG: glycosyltransferase family 2 protein [Candidatus Omnitrophica bacterium]|nr:glycosyltransferase family 2 protein [Candidatus Omnitrophota bacterium]
MPEISVIIPVFNEEKNIGPLCSKIKAALTPLKRSYEIIFVDDGSGDNSLKILKDIASGERAVRIISFTRNYGQTAALAAGFEHAQGDILVTMDADLQQDPADIPRLLQKMEQGYDIVSGWRKDRKDAFLTRRMPSQIANWLISKITAVNLHDYGCTLKVYKKKAIEHIYLHGEMHRFLPALASWNGIDIAEVPVKHHRRKYGKSSYGLSRTFRVILDLITVKFLLSFSTRPIQLFGGWGLLSLFFSVVSGTAVILMKLLRNKDMTGNPLLYLTVLLVVVGIQFIMIGLLGEVMARIYHESRKHPTYIVKEII